MMLFGDKKQFAIEAMIEPSLIPPSSPWGRMRIWVGDHSFGNIDDENCGLAQSFDSLARLADTTESLWREEFEGLNGLDLINFLDGRLYGCHGEDEIEDGRSIEQIKADADRYWAFSIFTNWGEQFDGYPKAFLLCPPGNGLQILSRDFPCENGYCFSVPIDSFRSVVRAAALWYQNQEQLLR